MHCFYEGDNCPSLRPGDPKMLDIDLYKLYGYIDDKVWIMLFIVLVTGVNSGDKNVRNITMI